MIPLRVRIMVTFKRETRNGEWDGGLLACWNVLFIDMSGDSKVFILNISLSHLIFCMQAIFPQGKKEWLETCGSRFHQ